MRPGVHCAKNDANMLKCSSQSDMGSGRNDSQLKPKTVTGNSCAFSAGNNGGGGRRRCSMA